GSAAFTFLVSDDETDQYAGGIVDARCVQYVLNLRHHVGRRPAELSSRPGKGTGRYTIQADAPDDELSIPLTWSNYNQGGIGRCTQAQPVGRRLVTSFQ